MKWVGVILLSFSTLALADYSEIYLEKLSKTKALNIEEIALGLDLFDSYPENPKLQNPYTPSFKLSSEPGRARQDIITWYQSYSKNSAVCGVKFLNSKDYLLQTFEDMEKLKDSAHQLTHHKPCGACSTLQDLSVYLKYHDLTTPVRNCTKKIGITKINKCLTKIGFSKMCAQSWAYNGWHTKKYWG